MRPMELNEENKSHIKSEESAGANSRQLNKPVDTVTLPKPKGNLVFALFIDNILKMQQAVNTNDFIITTSHGRMITNLKTGLVDQKSIKKKQLANGVLLTYEVIYPM